MKQIRFAVLLSTSIIVGLATLSYALEDPIPNINKRGSDEKKFAEQLGFAVVHAARSAPKNLKLLKFEQSTPELGRLVWDLKVEYYGSITGKKFEADIKVKIDTIKKEVWEISNIEYKDDNKVSLANPNTDKIQKLIKMMNAK
jgi:hypothetical protein